jgi:hypothetical protein
LCHTVRPSQYFGFDIMIIKTESFEKGVEQLFSKVQNKKRERPGDSRSLFLFTNSLLCSYSATQVDIL